MQSSVETSTYLLLRVDHAWQFKLIISIIPQNNSNSCFYFIPFDRITHAAYFNNNYGKHTVNSEASPPSIELHNLSLQFHGPRLSTAGDSREKAVQLPGSGESAATSIGTDPLKQAPGKIPLQMKVSLHLEERQSDICRLYRSGKVHIPTAAPISLYPYQCMSIC